MASKSTVKFKIIDHGANELSFQLNTLEGAFVDIGVFGGTKRNADDEVSIALYALYNELGAKKAGKNRNITIPERSFIRSTVDNNRRRYNNFLRKALTAVTLGQKTSEQVLTELGIIIQGDIKKTITELSSPANADSTKAAKKSSNPLIDSGTMRRAIHKRVTI